MTQSYTRKFYIAGRYSRRAEFIFVRDALQRRGHQVTSSWLDSCYEITEEKEGDPTHCPPEHREAIANRDFSDIFSADIVLCFTEPPRTPSRGGRHVEMGIGLGLMKRVHVIGPRENIFCFHEDVRCFDTLDEYLGHLDAGE